MRAKVNMLFSVVTPYMVCKDLKLHIENGDSNLPVVKDPKVNNNKFLVLSREFVSLSVSDKLQYGNIIDFISYSKSISYTASFDYVLSQFESHIDAALFSSLKWLKRDIVEYLENLKTINNRLLKLKSNLQRALSIKCFLTDKNLIWANNPQFVIPSNGSDIQALFKDIKSVEFSKISLDVRSSDSYALYVYYVNYHTTVSYTHLTLPTTPYV